MFIRVALPNKDEGIFNADCSVALLLGTIKKIHHLPQQDEIDLCSEDGALKQLPSHLSAASGTPFFELRELCLVVRATTSGTEDGTSDDGYTSPVTYVPVLEEYQNDEDLVAALNTNSGDGKHSGDYSKGRKKSGNRAGSKPGTPEGGKHKLAPSSAALNTNSGDGKHSGDYSKGHKKSGNRAGSKPGTPEGGKNKLAPSKVSNKSRRLSVAK